MPVPQLASGMMGEVGKNCIVRRADGAVLRYGIEAYYYIAYEMSGRGARTRPSAGASSAPAGSPPP